LFNLVVTLVILSSCDIDKAYVKEYYTR